MRASHRVFVSLVVIALISVTSCGQASPTLIPTVAAISTSTRVPTTTPVATVQSADSERKVKVSDLERSYLLHIPPDLDLSQPAPLIFVFHGLGDDPAEMQLLTGFNEIADKFSFLLVYPVGVGQSWNAGGKCCGEALTNKIDDIAFVRQILLDLATVVRVDKKRIYATGFSNGGALADRLACEMPDVFAAVASVAGILSYSPCQPQQPISVMHIHGLSDYILPYKGGGSFEIRPVEEIMSSWAELNGCIDSPTVESPIKGIKHIVYVSCQAGTGVELYALQGEGHAWPSKDTWDASQIIWAFFAAHQKL